MYIARMLTIALS